MKSIYDSETDIPTDLAMFFFICLNINLKNLSRTKDKIKILKVGLPFLDIFYATYFKCLAQNFTMNF